MGRKKKDIDDAFFAEFDAVDEDDNSKEEQVAPATKKKEKKKGKKKGKKAAAFDSEDDVEEPTLALPPPGSDEEDDMDDHDEPVNLVASKKSNKKKSKSSGASAYALLMGEGDEENEKEEEEDDEAAAEYHNVEGNGKELSSSLRVAEILSVSPHPKADRLRVCSVDGGTAGIVTVVTNAVEVAEGMLVVLAPVGCTLPGNGMKVGQMALRGVDSYGMLCSAYDIGWNSDPDGVLVQLPEGEFCVGDSCPTSPASGKVGDQPAGKKEKKKKGVAASKEDVDSAFAALALEEDAQEGEGGDAGEEAPIKEKKKKKKKVIDTESLFAALAEEDPSVDVAEDADMLAFNKDEKKKKKKTKARGEEIDFEALLGGGGGETGEDASAGGGARVSSVSEFKKKESKKRTDAAAAAAAEDEDLDALLAEIDAPKPSVSTSTELKSGAGKKDKKKKGGKDGAGVHSKDTEEEDLDALLAELGMKPEDEHVAEPSAVEVPENSVVDGGADGGGDKELSAAAKKKAKKKAKEKAKKEGSTSVAPEAGNEDAEPEADSEKAGTGGKGGGKKPAKVSAAVRRMQEALEAKRRAEEEAARLEEEARLREEEEERLRVEEEARKAQDAERRKAEKAARREQLKKEGKLLTGKAKAEAERLARVRDQLLRQAGVDPEAIAPKKKPVYTKRKAQPVKKKTEEEEEGEKRSTALATVTEAEPDQPPAELSTASADQHEEPAVPGVDSWEEAVDDWDALDEDALKLPTTAEDEEDADLKRKTVAAAAATAASNGGTAKAKAGPKQPAKDGGSIPNPPGSSDEEDEEAESSSGSESESESDSEDSSGSSSGSEYSSSEEDSSSDEEDDSDAEMEARIAVAREKREARLREALANRDPSDLRSPICCILGHVDTGKTKILDNIRRTNVQDGEAGGITQQIGATYIPGDALQKRTEELRGGRAFDLKLPGLLVIDTPGHESFSNLRSRGSGLCDIAVLVVDLMHGLEQQTIESINLLRMRKTPFVIALNKVDRIYKWNSVPNSPIMAALDRQDPSSIKEFEHRMDQCMLQLNEQGLNVALYWKNKDPKTFINIVPTSAISGEGIPDLLQLIVKLTQSLMVDRLMFVPELQCTVLEVKQIEGLGTTIDVVLINGALKEGDTIVVCGLNGPIVTTIRALLTPQPLREIRVKGQYVHHKELRAAMGVKIAAHNLENAVAGTQLFKVSPDDDLEALKEEVMEDMSDIFTSVDKTGEGVCVQASTLGSLEALLEFLRSDAVKIPVSAINIGPVHKRDVMRANVMIERKVRKYGVILAFDVPVNKEARETAEDLGVRIFTADIIYHLFDQFTSYLKRMKEEEQEAAREEAVFPCVLRILPDCIFNKKDPIVLGVEVVEGIAKVGTPLCIPSQGKIDLGRIFGLEKDHKAVDTARAGDKVAMKIESTKPEEAARLYGRHFDHTDALVSRISRKSIDVLKEMFREDLGKEDWKLVIRLKKVFGID